MNDNGALPHCHAPDCPSRAFRGGEADDRHAKSEGVGHAIVHGEPWHHGCAFRRVRAAVMEPPPAEPVKPIAASCVDRYGGHIPGKFGVCVRCSTPS